MRTDSGPSISSTADIISKRLPDITSICGTIKSQPGGVEAEHESPDVRCRELWCEFFLDGNWDAEAFVVIPEDETKCGNGGVS